MILSSISLAIFELNKTSWLICQPETKLDELIMSALGVTLRAERAMTFKAWLR